MTYRIRISVKGLEIEVEGDEEFIERKLSDLSWLDGVLNKIESYGTVRESESPEGMRSFSEFINEFEPRTNAQKFLTIAYYLYKTQGKDLTYDDVEEYYRKARWHLPGNPRDVMSNLVRERFIEEAGKVDGRKVFRILRKGIKYVESGFRRGEERE